MKWLVAGAVVVVVAGVAAWLLLRPADPPLNYGAPGFPPRGELIGDKGLVEDAAQAWRDAPKPPKETIIALWAGRVGDARKVVLRSGRSATTVEIPEDGEPRASAPEVVAKGSPIVLANGGIVVAEGASERWTDSSRGEVRAKDGFVPYANDESFVALAPQGDAAGDEIVPVLVGAGDGIPWPAAVDAEDWPQVRDQLSKDETSKLAAAALAGAAAALTGPEAEIPAVSLLPGADLPGTQAAYAASARNPDGIAITFATEGDDDPQVDVLGTSDTEPALAAMAITDGFVVAGDPEIVRLEIRTGGRTERRRGSFAYLPGVTEAEVAGFTRDGQQVEPALDG